MREKKKAQVLVELRLEGVDTTQKYFLKPELIDLCNSINILASYNADNMEPEWLD